MVEINFNLLSCKIPPGSHIDMKTPSCDSVLIKIEINTFMRPKKDNGYVARFQTRDVINILHGYPAPTMLAVM